MKKKKENLMDAAKETVGLGIMSGAGIGVMGFMGSMAPGSGVVTAPVGAGLTLLNVGRMAKTGMTVANTMSNNSKSRNKQKTLLDKIW